MDSFQTFNFLCGLSTVLFSLLSSSPDSLLLAPYVKETGYRRVGFGAVRWENLTFEFPCHMSCGLSVNGTTAAPVHGGTAARLNFLISSHCHLFSHMNIPPVAP
jgi:hypothetical protein